MVMFYDVSIDITTSRTSFGIGRSKNRVASAHSKITEQAPITMLTGSASRLGHKH